MKPAMRWTPAALLFLAAPLLAQDLTHRRLELRVVSSPTPGTVTVDRGRNDRIEVGDAVELRPRSGEILHGTIARIDERSALVELQLRAVSPAPGTRGEVLVPVGRFEQPRPVPPPPPVEPSPVDPQQPQPQQPGQEPPQDPTKPEWRNRDENYTPDKPLLAQVDAVPPSERLAGLSGRLYVIGDATKHPESDFDESFIRAGIDARLTNPFHLGGELRFDGELNSRTEYNDADGGNGLVRDFSYRLGGDRFSPQMWKLGRFLQVGMPEFGILDGIEWGIRGHFGDRFGAAVGFMPEPNDNLDGWDDVQASLYYVWSADLAQTISFGGGFQKTWHDGDSDRDLVVLKGHYLPLDAWQLHGTFWIDYYRGNDVNKGTGLELTQAVASASRSYENGNRLQFAWRRNAYPEVLRQDYLPTWAAEIARAESDLLSFDGWWRWSRETDLHTYLAAWNDDDHEGVAGELGFERKDWFGERSRTTVALFGNTGDAVAVIGGRVIWETDANDGMWQWLYEYSHVHEFGFPSDVADLDQHRFRGSRSFYTAAGQDLSVYGQLDLIGEDLAWSIGFYMQQKF